jgi:hypothetical protein
LGFLAALFTTAGSVLTGATDACSTTAAASVFTSAATATSGTVGATALGAVALASFWDDLDAFDLDVATVDTPH